MVHVHSPYPLGELSAWLFQRKVPLVISHHSDIVKQKTILRFYGPILKRVIRRAARIVATNPVYIQTSRWLKPVEEKCVVVSSSVDQHLYHPPTEAFEGPPTLLFVGRLRYYKGLDTLLRALPDLPGVTVRIAGEGPMKAEWEVLATALKVKDQVEFIGHVADEDLPELYRKAHLFVLPANARSEAFGLVMVEAMSCGLPCITTEIGTGTSWVVQDGVTGLVVPPKDPAALASAIRSLLDDPDRRASMAVAARQRVELHFSHERMVEGMTKIYEELVPGQRSDGVFGKGNA